jgi:hypothetical protein
MQCIMHAHVPVHIVCGQRKGNKGIGVTLIRWSRGGERKGETEGRWERALLDGTVAAHPLYTFIRNDKIPQNRGPPPPRLHQNIPCRPAALDSVSLSLDSSYTSTGIVGAASTGAFTGAGVGADKAHSALAAGVASKTLRSSPAADRASPRSRIQFCRHIGATGLKLVLLYPGETACSPPPFMLLEQKSKRKGAQVRG